MKHRFTNIKGEAFDLTSGSGGRYQSQLERDGYIKELMDPRATRATMQDPRIYLKTILGRRYTADLRVRYVHPQEKAFEFKYSWALDKDPGLNELHEKVAVDMARLGFAFAVQTELDVYTPDFRMRKFAFEHRNLPQAPECDEIVNHVRCCHGIRVEQLIKDIAGQGVTAQLELVPEVWRLVGLHILTVDFDQVLNLRTALHCS